MKYSFYNKKEFLGELSLENSTQATQLGTIMGATLFVNISSNVVYMRCSNCGCWEKIDDLIDGYCAFCDYIGRIEKWLDFYDDELSKHFDGEIDNYGEEFVITFKGKELRLDFGASEDSYFIQGIKDLLKELKEENEL